MIDIGSKFIHADTYGEDYGKQTYKIVNTKSNAVIGMVGWYPAWHTYTFYPQEAAVFDMKCLKNITAFMEKLSAMVS